MVHNPVNRGGRRHRVPKYLVPLAEDQIAGNHHRPAFVPLRHQREQDFHLLRGLLNLADVIQYEDVEVVQTPERPRELEVPLGQQQLLNKSEGGCKED